MAAVCITVEFCGGLEALFANRRELQLALAPPPPTLAGLVRLLCDEEMSDARREMFVVDGHVRPGILVLVNDADWELLGEEAYQIQAGDRIVFVSTLHGG